MPATVQIPEQYRNNKTGDIYKTILAATDCTNKNKGKTMVVYLSQKNNEVYTREITEFLDKFTLV